MRIIAGTLGGRRLKTAEADGLRPAMAKTREALFSSLEARGCVWQGANVLDLFAGCGSLALECLSRGAASAWMVDNGKEAWACLRQNSSIPEVSGQCHIFRDSALKFLRQTPPCLFDLVFIDPPYRRNLLEPTLPLLDSGAWLKSGSMIVAETEQPCRALVPPSFKPEMERLFGQTLLQLWIKE